MVEEEKEQQEAKDDRKERVPASRLPVTEVTELADFRAKAKRRAKREKEEQKKRLRDALQVGRAWVLYARFDRIKSLICKWLIRR